jgi:hypothetical protein
MDDKQPLSARLLPFWTRIQRQPKSLKRMEIGKAANECRYSSVHNTTCRSKGVVERVVEPTRSAWLL